MTDNERHDGVETSWDWLIETVTSSPPYEWNEYSGRLKPGVARSCGEVYDYLQRRFTNKAVYISLFHVAQGD
jgi:hypothetical protein